MLENKIPVHGIGMQAHFMKENPPDFASVYANVKRFTELGLDVQFTEVDVRIRNPVTPAKIKHQAEIYSITTVIKREIVNPTLSIADILH
jgi:endo-1,4-beta-xylanase